MFSHKQDIPVSITHLKSGGGGAAAASSAAMAVSIQLPTTIGSIVLGEYLLYLSNSNTRKRAG